MADESKIYKFTKQPGTDKYRVSYPNGINLRHLPTQIGVIAPGTVGGVIDDPEMLLDISPSYIDYSSSVYGKNSILKSSVVVNSSVLQLNVANIENSSFALSKATICNSHMSVKAFHCSIQVENSDVIDVDIMNAQYTVPMHVNLIECQLRGSGIYDSEVNAFCLRMNFSEMRNINRGTIHQDGHKPIYDISDSTICQSKILNATLHGVRGINFTDMEFMVGRPIIRSHPTKADLVCWSTGARPVNGVVRLYKRINADFTSGYDSSFVYPESGVVECPDYNPYEDVSCGSGLHFSHINYRAWGYDGDESHKHKWLAADIHMDDIISVREGKVRCKKATIVGVVD